MKHKVIIFNQMLESKNKLRLSALLISVSIIAVVLCYVIVLDKTVSVNVFINIIVVVGLLAIIISQISNPFIANIFIKILDFVMLNFLGRNINTLEKQVNFQQIKNKKQDEYIKSRPILHFFVVAVIIIIFGFFVVTLIYQSLQLMK